MNDIKDLNLPENPADLTPAQRLAVAEFALKQMRELYDIFDRGLSENKEYINEDTGGNGDGE